MLLDWNVDVTGYDYKADGQRQVNPRMIETSALLNEKYDRDQAPESDEEVGVRTRTFRGLAEVPVVSALRRSLRDRLQPEERSPKQARSVGSGSSRNKVRLVPRVSESDTKNVPPAAKPDAVADKKAKYPMGNYPSTLGVS